MLTLCFLDRIGEKSSQQDCVTLKYTLCFFLAAPWHRHRF